MLNILKNEIKYIDIGYILLLLIPTLLIFDYGRFRCINIAKLEDPFEAEMFKGSDKFGLDGWSFFHFVLFLFVGYFYNKVFVITMSLGILWEFFETFVGIYKPEIIKGWGFCQLSGNKYKVWWYGKISDPIANFLGFITGSLLNNYIN